MSWRTVLVEDGESLRLKLDSVVIEKGGKQFTIPLSDIAIIILDGLETTVSTRLLAALNKNNIVLVNCDVTHHPSGIFTALNGHSRASKMIQYQINLDDLSKGMIWKKIVDYKIRNQIAMLEYYSSDEAAIQRLYTYSNQLEHYDQTNREGHAAKVYFNALLGKGFTRTDENHIINAGLNYGYAVIRAHLARLVVSYGLSPMLGIFHCNEYNQFNLVDDLMEPFRPFIDCVVYETLKDERYFKGEHRQSLIGLTNKRCYYKGGNYTLQEVLKKFVEDFVSILKTGEIEKLVYPDLTKFEVLV